MEKEEDYKLRDAQSYDDVAVSFDKFTEQYSTYAVGALLDRANAASADRIVDIGCGTGIVSIAAARLPARQGAEVIGLDLSEGMLNFARQKAAMEKLERTLTFVRGDAEAIEMDDASADAVVSLYALLHLPNPDKCLAEIHRILKPGGRVAIAVGSSPNLFSLDGIRAGFARITRTIARARGMERAANEHIDALARVHLPKPPDEDNPELSSSHHDFSGSLSDLVTKAGFVDVRTSWLGREYEIPTAEDFWELQTTFSTFARKRMLAASDDELARLRSAFDADCQAVLNRGGRLVYRVGASVVSCRRP